MKMIAHAIVKSSGQKIAAETAHPCPHTPGLRCGRGYAFFIAILCFLPAHLNLACQRSATGSSSVLLNPNTSIQRSLVGGEIHSYRIPLSSGQYLRVLVDGRNNELTAAVYGPDDQLITERNCLEEASTPLSLVVKISGVYRLSVRSTKKEADTGNYEVKIAEIRPASSQDKDRISGERAFAEGERLRMEQRAESSRQAAASYEKAVLYWRAAGEKRGEADTLKIAGEVYHRLGDLQKAIECYQRVLSLSHEMKDLLLESELLSKVSDVYIDLGRTQEAKDHCTRALSLSREGRHARGEAQGLNCIGEVYYNLGERQQALGNYQQALPLWEEQKDRRGQAQTLLFIGDIYSELGNAQKAFDNYNQSLNFWRAANDRRGQALTLTAIAHLNSTLGEKQEALDIYDRARPIIQSVGDRIGQARILNGIGFVYESYGDKDRALDNYNQALHIYQEVNSPEREAGALIVIGRIYYSLGEHQKALIHFQRARSVIQSTVNHRFEPHVLRNIGTVYDSLGNKKKALHYYHQAFSLHKASGYQRGEADALNDIGRVHVHSGMKQKALGYFNKALLLNQATGDRFAESRTLYNIARAERDRGRSLESRNRLENAIGIVESLRANVAIHTLRASYFDSIQQYFELNIDLIMLSHKQRPAGNFDAQGFEQCERARARSLLEQLTEAHADFLRWGDPELIRRLREIQREINAKAQRKMQLLNAGAIEGELLTIAKEIAALVLEREQVAAQIRARRPGDSVTTLPQPSSLKEVQQLLDDDTLLLEYALGSERSYLWAVTRTRLKSYTLPSRARIEKAALPVYNLLASEQLIPSQTAKQREEKYWRQASALGDMLLKPVADQLGNKRLLIVADGVLQYIPFAALPIPGREGGTERLKDRERGRRGEGETRRKARAVTHGPSVPPSLRPSVSPSPLIVEHEIVNLPSASTLAVLRGEMAGRRAAPKAVAVLADPVFESDDLRVLEAMGNIKGAQGSQVAVNPPVPLSRLRGLKRGGGFGRLRATENEARAIEEFTSKPERLVAKGFDASRAMATDPALGQYRIVHFATHGILDRENPELSAIVLSLVDRQGRPQDGYLRLHDIYNLNLPVELVVLSGCDTGLGKEFKGEGLVGLTRGFMYAGAARVMASLWKVEDEPTAILMRNFYRNMLKEGLPPATALRKAQIALWQSGDWRQPNYWAAFVIQGEWR
jgi:CHAT domain-containing protein/predicted negative regulator of RcsB-dependent stress response